MRIYITPVLEEEESGNRIERNGTSRGSYIREILVCGVGHTCG